VIFWGCAIMIVGACIQASTHGAGQLIAGRIISGIGNGMNTSTIPVYVSETARSNRRGSMIAVQLSIVIFGIVMAYWIDYGTVRNLTGEAVWRFPIAFQIVFALITLSTILLLPESPRWLYGHGRKDESISVLSRLMSCDEDDEQVLYIVNEMEEAVRLESEQVKFQLKSILKDQTDVKTTRRLILCFMVQMMQQFTGINVTAFYVTIVLQKNVGLSLDTSALVAGFIQLAFWVGTLPPIWTVERFGRRPTLLIGSVVLSISLILFTVGIAVPTQGGSNLALAMLVIYEIAFGMSWNCLPWIIAPEITPLHLRHVGGAVGPFSEWLWTVVIVLMAPTAIANTGWKIYLLFIFMTVLSFPFVYFFLPEVCFSRLFITMSFNSLSSLTQYMQTQGKSLEEIDYLFASGEAREQLEKRFHEAAGRTERIGVEPKGEYEPGHVEGDLA